MLGKLFDVNDLGKQPRLQNEELIRSLSRCHYLYGDLSVCRVLGKYKMFVDNRDIGLSSHLILDGYWEMWMTEAVAKLLKPGMKAVDAGANLGYYTLLFADLVGHQGSVSAFEPNPNMATRLKNSISISGFDHNTRVHTVALSDRDGEVFLKIPENEPKNAFISDMRQDNEALQIPSRRLDSFEELADVDFIKIDVEGAEESLWRGMTKILDAAKPVTIILEFNMSRYENSGSFIEQIERYGFKLEFIDPSRGIIPTNRTEIMDRPPHEDQLLVLTR